MTTVIASIYGVGIGLLLGVLIGFKFIRKDNAAEKAKHAETVKGLLGVLDDSISNVNKLLDQNRKLQKFILSGFEGGSDCDPELDDDDDDDDDDGQQVREFNARNN